MSLSFARFQNTGRGSACIFLAGLLLGLGGLSALATVPRDHVVFVEMTADESTPAITLSWPSDSQASSFTISRKALTDSTWTLMATLSGDSTGWTDTSVLMATSYEYQVRCDHMSPNNLVSWGHICAGMRIPAVDHRGTVILIVDDTMAVPLSAELQRLVEDLIGDGWSVIRHDVARTAAVTDVKALIVADYAANPGEVKSVFLFGHVPVPYSGDTSEGHPEHAGAWPADVYYVEFDGNWTDSTVNNPNGWFAENHNVPGDGKFDQTWIPDPAGIGYGTLELEIGRVDLANMPVFMPKTETDLLRQYLNKDHAHRHAVSVLPRKAIVDDRFGEFSGLAMAQCGWSSWTSLLGAANVTAGTFAEVTSQPQLCFYLCGGGWLDSVDNIHTSDFASGDPKAAFTMIFGSWFGDWDKGNNILRAPLATESYGLVCGWAGFPLWFLHRMGLGGTIGDSARLAQQNGFWYGKDVYQPVNPNSQMITTALMGDPTLRLFAVVPPTNLAISRDAGNHSQLSWTASPDASLGYHIYRAGNAAGPFVRLTSNPVLGTGWTDSSVSAGTFTYQVKAVKLEASAAGTYTNTSQALTKTIDLDAVTYASWVSDNGLVGNDALPEADTDKNGINNLTEYALGINHGATALTGLPIIGTANGEITITYRPVRNDVTYEPVWSPDLNSWNLTGFTFTQSGDATTAHLPISTDQKKFLRLKITK